MTRLDELVSDRVSLKKGQSLYTAGSPLQALYAIRLGTIKTQLTLPDGRFQVTGFHLPGEVIGLDAMGEQHHISDAYAMEDTQLCVMRVPEIEHLAHALPSLQQQLNRLMSREIARDQLLILALGSMRAEERLAAFLLNLSQRYATRGYAASEFVLRMSREEIGSYLGVKLETVSRLFSRFADVGLLETKQRHIRILDMEGLKALIHSPA